MADNNTYPEECGIPSMAMYFHTEPCQYILFQAFKTSSNKGLLGGCLCVFVFAFLYEGLKTLRDCCFFWLPVRHVNPVEPGTKQKIKWTWRDMFTYGHVLQAVLHVVQMLWSYSMMLIFMTYNAWLCMALLLGAMLGYFVFAPASTSKGDTFEHCH
ncbi:high affinity copper uptake protein 1-like [Mizuhopecten yessoensis]|uniref:Copper transport protein n=1 Tax=Mizuhopecten yessoensis TaxID=6573 RepID=A0A210PSY5_MIZYE|nr:high affinity copper uptake protein 1-like [Mizuhopecten yessoensis]OWF39610.1 High affinity copper uptake protein 1 [Mizuhopecten yessoensis]